MRPSAIANLVASASPTTPEVLSQSPVRWSYGDRRHPTQCGNRHVEELLRNEARNRNLEFDRVLNEAVRAGFARNGERFVQKTYPMGAMDDPKRFSPSSMNWTTWNA